MYWANRNPSSCAYTVLERSEFVTIYAYHQIVMTKMFTVIKRQGLMQHLGILMQHLGIAVRLHGGARANEVLVTCYQIA
jgi:hypothetical protein